MRFAAPLALAIAAFAGCTTPAADDGHHMHQMDADSFHMSFSGMPSGPMSPGQMFNVTVMAQHGAGLEDMDAMTSDHIGAHYWNMSMADPTSGLSHAMTCVHQTAEAPGTYTTLCQAPMEPGTYHMRSHMRMMDAGQMTHHYWSDEQTFTVA
ncbi:MAG: hypothetical protein ACYC2H_06775 [Thermoplasmatota archaeon]